MKKKTLMRKSRVKGPEREERKRQKWGKEEEKKETDGAGREGNGGRTELETNYQTTAESPSC